MIAWRTRGRGTTGRPSSSISRPSAPRIHARVAAIGIDLPRRARTMAYWACARLEPQRERLALHCLGGGGYENHYPRPCDRGGPFCGQVGAPVGVVSVLLCVRVDRRW